MALPIVFSRNLAVASTTTLVDVTVGTTAAGTAFTLVTTVLDAQRRVLFTPAGNEASNTFRIIGTNQAGNPITETLAGANATSFYSNLDYKTVSSITPLSNTAGTMSVGTNGVGSSLWQIVNWNVQPFNLGFSVEVRTGTATFNIEHTFDDPNNLLAGLVYPLPFGHPLVQGASNTTEGSYTTPITAIRLTTISGTGTLWFRGMQEGMASP